MSSEQPRLMSWPRGLAVTFAVLLVVVACSSPAADTSSPVLGTPPPTLGSPSPAPAEGQTQVNETGQVTVSATWGGPTAGAVFDLALDTHSVDLDALALSDAVLRNDRGQTLATPRWAASAGGHHRSGALSFAGDSTSFLAGARWVELTLFNIGDVPERTLRWEIGG